MILSVVAVAWGSGTDVSNGSAVPAEGPADCALDEHAYYAIRDGLHELRRDQRGSLGVVARTPRCEAALHAVLRNDPFLAAHQTDGPSVDDRCVAVLAPAAAGWALSTAGDCDDGARVPAPDDTLTFAPWLPYGVSSRYNRDLGDGISILADFAWHPPRLWRDDLDLGPHLGPESRRSSIMRGLIGVDLTQVGLAGTYFGTRGGVEADTPVGKAIPRYGIVEFVGGRKWIQNGAAVQLGGGVLCEIPLGHGPKPQIVSPVAELRVGFASRN